MCIDQGGGVNTTLGETLRRQRVRAGLTQQELAGRAGISVRSLRDIEQDRVASPHRSSLRRLASALDLPDGTLLAIAGARTAQRLWIGVLGPLAVRRGDRPVEIASARQGVLLALLAIQIGQTVSTDEIVDVLWGDRPPRSCLRLVHTYVGQVRAHLEPNRAARTPSRLVRRVRTGYRLDLDTGQLDLATFDDLAGQADLARARQDLPAAVELLDRALACWRGPVLAGADPRLVQHPATIAVARRRVAAALAYGDIALAVGRGTEAAARLRGLLHDEPLHEGVAARLIRALAGCGEQAAALALAAEVRARLADELGIEPGPELREAQLEVLRGQAAPQARHPSGGSGRPAQLPAVVPHFVGRTAELAKLSRLSEESTGTAVISVISGMAGVGKTTLALHWAHGLANHFPDGQLYLNLRGFGAAGEPIAPHTAVRWLLDALDVPPQRVPSDLDAQLALYRSLLADRRMLIVLDNARDAAQVRPLLPSMPGCLTLVTSRDRLTGLVATEGAHPLLLGLLSPANARELLTRRLGTRRAAAEPEAVEEIAMHCARLPLALAIAAAWAATHPTVELRTLAAELRDTHRRLDVLTTGDPVANVRAVFSWSYHHVSAPAARLFRLLGLHRGPEISTRAAASLAGAPARVVAELLTELTEAELVAEPAPGRYTCHDLLRAYAAEMAEGGDSEAERSAAVRRVLDHLLHTAYQAAHLLHPLRRRFVPDPPVPGVVPERFTGKPEALAWLTAEHQVLLAAAAWAATTGHDRHAYQIAWCLNDFLDWRGHWHDWAASQQIAIEAAGRLGDPAAQALAHRGMAGSHVRRGDYTAARRHLDLALGLLNEPAVAAERAAVHLNLATVCGRQDRPAEALHHSRKSLDLCRDRGDQIGEGHALESIAWACLLLGDHREALRHGESSLEHAQQLGNQEAEAASWDTLGQAHHHLGEYAEALTCHRNALALCRAHGNRYFEARALERLGDAHHATGDARTARQHWRQALAILDELGNPDVGQLRTKLRA